MRQSPRSKQQGASPGIDSMPPQEFRRLFNALPGQYLILSPELVILDANDSYLRATKKSRDKIQGKYLFEAFPDNPDDPAATGVTNLRASLERALENKAPDTMPIQRYDIKRPDHEGNGFEERYWSPINMPVMDEAGQVKFIIHRVENVTDYVLLKQGQKKCIETADELKDQSDKMEADIFLRSRELQRLNDELRKERELRENFIRTLTHDLFGPLTAAKASIQLMMRHSDRKDRLPTLGARAVHSLNRMEHMIRDLLDADRVRAGLGLNLELSESDLVACAKRVIDDYTTIHGERFQLNAPETVKGNWNEEALERVLENLIGNAIKYGDANSPITITVKKTDTHAFLSVHNYGNPIAEEDQKGIFLPFVRSRKAETSGKRGWGIGLVLVKGMIQALGGDITVESTAEAGTTFRIELSL